MIILNPFLDTYQVIGGNINSASDLADLRSRQMTKARLYLQKAADTLTQLQLING
jgi:hypothetical protein